VRRFMMVITKSRLPSCAARDISETTTLHLLRGGSCTCGDVKPSDVAEISDETSTLNASPFWDLDQVVLMRT
jgi:hypothetical protein